MSQIDIPKNERGVIRVFAVNRSALEVAATLKTTPKEALAAELLGAPGLDTSGAELFAVSDLEGVGLAGYLADGYAVEEAQLARDRTRLEALDGYVLLVFSDSFDGKAARLDPGQDVTLIGTYSEFQPDLAGAPVTAESAKPFSGTPGQTPPTAPRGRAGSALVVMAIAAGIVLLLWWLLA
ncbi:hypothetical protein R5H30_17375 [Sulfitobacter sp. D35]|uniref:hypothetical protein n=1 Tax=Sulfitobacter sp. D35 TaxID=3083252 RepID=UPI00296FB9B3|nr:hypothetical protein [Sulfitobacter sp. D35]MDW4499768.1 hypothetical protein [Sulfitobacter sp. D35]